MYTGCIAGCDFDEQDFCDWKNEVTSDEIFGWEHWNGQTETPDTGPDDDFSKPGCEANISYCDFDENNHDFHSFLQEIHLSFSCFFLMQWGCTCYWTPCIV